jgi:hypothetical protein
MPDPNLPLLEDAVHKLAPFLDEIVFVGGITLGLLITDKAAAPIRGKNDVVQLRDYLHQTCHSLDLSTRIVPHQFRHTFATEMLRSGVSFPVLMKLLGHFNPEMTMRYVDVALTDLQREFQLARAKPRHWVPQPKPPSSKLRAGFDGLIDSFQASQHALEIFRRSLPDGDKRNRLDRLAKRLTNILAETRKLKIT